MNLISKQRPNSVLGISLDGNRLEAVLIRRSGSSLLHQATASAALALSPLTGDPELVGREIRNHLDQAGIREKRCAVCIPATWILTMQTKLPDLPESEVASFLQIEAERGFTSGHESLYITSSRARAINGEQYAMQMAIPRNHLASLERALKAAQLKPTTFSLGSAAFGIADKGQGVLALMVGSEAVELLASAGGGIIALRSLDGSIEATDAGKRVNADLVAREIRITLGQLPAPLSQMIRAVRVFGRGEMARQFVVDFGSKVSSMGLRLEVMDHASTADFSKPVPADLTLSPAVALASNYLRGHESGPEFLPPYVPPWKQFVNEKIASKRLGWVTVAGGAVALIVGGAFVYQAIELSIWQKRWNEMEPKVTAMDKEQELIKKYKPWYDDKFTALQIMRTVAECFPEVGTVNARSLEIKDLSSISCAGVTSDAVAYLKMVENLQKQTNDITAINTGSLVGQAPNIQFSFTAQWGSGGQINGQ